MADTFMDLINGATLPLTGATVPVKLQGRLPGDPIDPNTTAGPLAGNTPYRQAVLDVVSTDGTVAIYTVKRPNPNMGGTGTLGQYSQSIHCDGVNESYVTKFDYDAFSANNWIVELNGVVLKYDATPADLTEFSVADVGGKLGITVGDGDPLPLGEIAVFKASSLVSTILSDGANTSVRKLVNPHDFVYCVGAAGWDATRAQLEFALS